MFDLGWSEMLVIGVVALIIVGPKDLPVLFRRVGQFVGKAKGMAREFSSAMNDAADQSGVRDLSTDINKSLKTATNPIGAASDELKKTAKSFTDDLDPNSETAKLAAERKAETKRIQAAAERASAERRLREAQQALDKARETEAATMADTGKTDT